MALIGIGIDIAQIDRFERMERLYGERFLRRILHPIERNLLERRKNRAEFLAGRFACKEAAKKALGEFPGWGIAWNDIYVVERKNGRPVLFFEGRAAALAAQLGVCAGQVSISHDGAIAVAEVVLESAQ
ncbi:MAG TPA: holo-ACP synthase [bacterium]|nr:holo-ACP synthase [bacterium]HQL61327.1 holo-ACP synthase [bacterium]